ncbi:hypothetical protein [Novosphingobium mangrovi (ex Huang et al. 2023)]|uniref:Homogentisate 1,2-dioxygenase n=1 Tax=Novosphingobium mangrovi (ex Huang et al. 2023) TaxID=2976432 RepID=A0ABT2I0J2_9SPHN|nr:hypothetical protein [Novosphingobium mangrovi (ex Huang et al. 2023)]MCT2398318.1 hypothetical protein [Novosphingobium mangrovi (ex Huang et al. 2023)]
MVETEKGPFVRTPFGIALAALALQPGATSAMAQESQPQPACPAEAAVLPAPYAGWSQRTAMNAATDPAHLADAQLEPGQAIDAVLASTPAVRYARRPEKPGGSVSFGGLYALEIKTAGTYRIALGSAAWIDLLRDGEALVSTAHGHGPECTGIRKVVAFSLTPGSYLLQISANASPRMPLLAVRVP